MLSEPTSNIFLYRAQHSCLVVLSIMMLKLSTLGFRCFQCVKVEGESRLVADPSVTCWGDDHVPIAAIGAAFLLASFALPVWAYLQIKWILFMREHLTPSPKLALEATRATESFGFIDRDLIPVTMATIA